MKTVLTLLALSMLNCGGSDANQPSSTTANDGSRAEGRAYEPNPLLSVYVDGPKPAAGADRYRMEVVLTNTGDEEVGLAPTKVWFSVWKDARQIDCEALDNQTIQTPPVLAAGDAFTFQADAVCALPSPGRYQVRAYLTLGTDDDELDLERHFAGSYWVTRR